MSVVVGRTQIHEAEGKLHPNAVSGVWDLAVAVVEDDVVRNVSLPKRREAIRRILLARQQLLDVVSQVALFLLARKDEESAGPARARRGE